MPCFWKMPAFMPSVGAWFAQASIWPIATFRVSAPLAADTIATLADTSTIERRAIRIGIFTSKQPWRSVHHGETRKAGSTGPAYDNSNCRIACKPQRKLWDRGPRGISSHYLRGPRPDTVHAFNGCIGAPLTVLCGDSNACGARSQWRKAGIRKARSKSNISAHRNYRGRDRSSDAEGATAPETLRQKDRDD